MIQSIIIEDSTNANFLQGILRQHYPIIDLSHTYQIDKNLDLSWHKDLDSLVFIISNDPNLILQNEKLLMQVSEFDSILISTQTTALAISLLPDRMTLLEPPFDLGNFKYIVNQLIEKKLSREVMPSSCMTTSTSQKMVIQSVDAYHFVYKSDIIRLEADDGYTALYLTSGDRVVATKTIREFEQQLGEDFCRIHKKHLINLHHMATYNKQGGGTVIMKDRSEVAISRRKKESIYNYIRALTESV